MIRNGIIVCGPRDFLNAGFIYKKLDEFILPLHGRERDGIVLITGGAKGVDTIAHDWGLFHGIRTSVHPAHWDKYNKAAGMIRNREMAQLAFAYGCLGFCANPITRGTGNMLKTASDCGLIVKKIHIPMSQYHNT